MKRGYRFRCYPNRAQQEQFSRTFGAARFVYNWGLRTRTDAWFGEQKRVGYHETAAMLTDLKKQDDTVWLNDVSNVVLQQSLRHLHTGFLNFWNPKIKARYPSFKKKNGNQSAAYMSNGFSWRNGALTLAKQDAPLKVRWSRELPAGQPSSVTVNMDRTGRYFVSFLFDVTIHPLKRIKTAIGIDLGVKDFAAFSTGEKILAPKHYQKAQAKLKRANRRLHRRAKGSKNRAKARVLLAKAHARIADQRQDFVHKLSTKLIRENQTIVVESLQIANMVRNHCLAKSIITQGWGMFIVFLAYKAVWYGRTLHRIDRWYPSSKRCSACGHVLEHLGLDARRWTCPECHATHDRDVNAAINILAAGKAEMSTVGAHGN